MADRAKSIFQSACAYSKAARCVNERTELDPALQLPSLAIAALALELYFKSLYFIETNLDFQINGKFSHDFYALFGSLSENSRNQLDSQFHEMIVQRDMRDVETMEGHIRIIIPRDLEGNLKSWSDVFTKVRYFHDRLSEPKSMMFFPELESVIREAIFMVRPDLRRYNSVQPTGSGGG